MKRESGNEKLAKRVPADVEEAEEKRDRSTSSKERHEDMDGSIIHQVLGS